MKPAPYATGHAAIDAHRPMKLTPQPKEGLIDGQKSGTGNDASSRSPQSTGAVTKKEPPKRQVTGEQPYGMPPKKGRRDYRKGK